MPPVSRPRHCRRKAYLAFHQQCADLETSASLLHAAVAIAMHELPDATVGHAQAILDDIAQRVRSRARSGRQQALLAHLHDVLFEEEGFIGNGADYENPLNSYLPMVLETRLGLPITLALVYKLVAERVGLEAGGVNAPFHFLAYVVADGQTMIIDPFHGGELLTAEEVFRRIEDVSGTTLIRNPRMLAPATHRAWVARMIQNLISAFERQGRPDDLAAMVELRTLLN